MKVLELFAGSRSVGNYCESQGHEIFSSDVNDFEGIDYVTDILNFETQKVPFIPQMIWASPPCTYFSVASIGVHWNEDHTPKTDNALKGVAYVKKTLEIINYFLRLNPNLKYYIENPCGKLRKLKVIRGHNRFKLTYCSYGDNRMKPTDIWSNNIFDMFNPDGWNPKPPCFNNNNKCDHESAPRGSKTGTQGLKNNYERSKIPELLVKEIVDSTNKKFINFTE